MMTGRTIRVVVDSLADTGEEFARKAWDEIARRGIAKQIEIQTSTLADNVKDTFANLVEVLSPVFEVRTPLRVESVTFTLGIDSNGTLSLLSTLSASVESKVGFTFTLKAPNGTNNG